MPYLVASDLPSKSAGKRFRELLNGPGIRMQTRAELYSAIGLHDYEALDASIIQTIIPTDN
jgi:hypothetical protein